LAWGGNGADLGLPPQVFFAWLATYQRKVTINFRTREKDGEIMTKIVTARSNDNGARTAHIESVADILERELDPVIHDWMMLVEKQEDLMSIGLSYEDRTGHLPALLREVIVRLRLDAGTKAPISVAASHHGDLRRKQGYTVAMVVEESRLLQVCLFTTLHKNTSRIEYSKLLLDVVTIADEVDAQLKQQMLRYMEANAVFTKSVV
jgi:hypothetical protein